MWFLCKEEARRCSASKRLRNCWSIDVSVQSMSWIIHTSHQYFRFQGNHVCSNLLPLYQYLIIQANTIQEEKEKISQRLGSVTWRKLMLCTTFTNVTAEYLGAGSRTGNKWWEEESREWPYISGRSPFTFYKPKECHFYAVVCCWNGRSP